MKNKILLSLALLVAANAFIATPAMAYTWADAKRHAAIAGKATLGAVAVGAAIALPILTYKTIYPSNIAGVPNAIGNVDNTGGWKLNSVRLQVDDTRVCLEYKKVVDNIISTVSKTFGPNYDRFLYTQYETDAIKTGLEILPPMPAIIILAGTASAVSGYAGYRLLISAWNDFKNINKSTNKSSKSITTNIDKDTLRAAIKGDIYTIFTQEVGIISRDYSIMAQGDADLENDLIDLYDSFNTSQEDAQKKLDAFCNKWELDRIII